MTRALGLFSGGLDSLLATLLLRKAGIETEGIAFETPFFNSNQAKLSAQMINLPLTFIDITKEHLEIVLKSPKYGYGAHLNPCIDCHGYMFRKALLILKKKKFDFLFSGEVLGQRPMSQNKQALDIVAKLSSKPELILRPLSTLALPPSFIEKKQLVDRNKMMGLKGRSRKPQISLAKEMGIKKFPPPAGGCLLTDHNFAQRIKNLLKDSCITNKNQINLLKWGRHFKISTQNKLIIGRNQKENGILHFLSPNKVTKLFNVESPGPLGIYIGPFKEKHIKKSIKIINDYKQKKNNNKKITKIKHKIFLT